MLGREIEESAALETVVLVKSIGRPAGWFGLVAGFLERGKGPQA